MSKNSFMGRIKSLDTGTKRLLLVIGLIFSFLIPSLSDLRVDDDFLPLVMLAGIAFIGFWILVRIVLWIIDGFKKAE